MMPDVYTRNYVNGKNTETGKNEGEDGHQGRIWSQEDVSFR